MEEKNGDTDNENNEEDNLESFMIILSGIYGILLVVVGLVLPLAETQIHPLYIFEVFYLYLFVTSMVFLIYVYVFLLHGANVGMSKLASLDSASNCSKFRKRRIAFDQTSNHHTGSFYLRLGAMGFGIGSMILDGLYFGQFFDIPHILSHCNDVMEAVKPAFKFFFTFTQLYFIFQNSKYPSLARFGLMHMSATNICVWFRVIVVETLNSIAEANHFIAKAEQTHVINGISPHSDPHPNEELSCYWSDSIGKILMAASPYLYPFCVEYSLICAAILYVMWQNVGKKENKMDSQYFDEFDDGRHKRAHRMSVDCAGSSRGLFLGLLFFIFGVVSTIAFYVLKNSDNSNKTADLLANLSETIIYLFAIVSIIVASVRMRTLKFKSLLKDRLEEILILISVTGLYMFGVFNLIAGFYYHDSIEGVLTIVTNITMMTEATMQTIFMFATMRMSASHPYHATEKPGTRIRNISITLSIAHNSLQLKFYGSTSWSIFEHISVPLGIFYRFHSTVCLSHVWKNAWKRKKQIRDKM
ncbi:hypothetical protein KUTeg_000404 [Tegillarca granosa]|uniref:Otopetrin n=1 Tax=Tegillarca granosa TaxID=220873 RepID=A0ABQ9FXH4_TEGGR|nr:hypothetical protein KUTeg_000404 [Tegillarca granosa]